MPTFSLDSGLVFERDASYFGRAFRQTLEPRAFYVYTPFRDQSQLPNYDSARNDFNFATIYTENAFGGNDRISDNNLLTLGVTTRLLDPDTGAEAARVRHRAAPALQGPAGHAAGRRAGQRAPVGRAVRRLDQLDAAMELRHHRAVQPQDRALDPLHHRRALQPAATTAWSAPPTACSAASERAAIDIGWQWPLNDLWGDKGQNLGPGRGEGEGRWYSVGPAELQPAGQAGWSMRWSAWNTMPAAGSAASCSSACRAARHGNKRVLFQLEFVGFTRLGSNALQSLKDNIPRYQFLREQVTTPSRFSNYD